MKTSVLCTVQKATAEQETISNSIATIKAHAKQYTIAVEALNAWDKKQTSPAPPAADPAVHQTQQPTAAGCNFDYFHVDDTSNPTPCLLDEDKYTERKGMVEAIRELPFRPSSLHYLAEINELVTREQVCASSSVYSQKAD